MYFVFHMEHKMDYFALRAEIRSRYDVEIDLIRDPAGRYYGDETGPVYVVTIRGEYTPMFGVSVAPQEILFLESRSSRDRLSVYSGYTLYDGILYPDEVGRVTLDNLNNFVPLKWKIQNYIKTLKGRLDQLDADGVLSRMLLAELGIDPVTDLSSLLDTN